MRKPSKDPKLPRAQVTKTLRSTGELELARSQVEQAVKRYHNYDCSRGDEVPDDAQFTWSNDGRLTVTWDHTKPASDHVCSSCNDE